MSTAQESDVRHITGDYYYDHAAYDDGAWLAAGICCVVFPPVGGAMLGWMVVGSLADPPEEEV